MSDPKTAAHGKIAFAVRAAVMGVAALIATGCALQPGSTNESDGGAATGRYQFGYVVSSPSGIHAQVFSGEAHTYVSLPSGVQLRAATGSDGLQPPTRKGPYWVVKGLSTQWHFATSKGMVNATATGAARQMALVSNAQAAIAQTMPTAAATSAVPAAAKNTAMKPLPAQVPGTKHTHTQIPAPPKNQPSKKQAKSVPEKWLHAARPAPHHSEVFFIPGAEGRIMPLQRALIHIIPAGWQTHISKYISPSIPVTWHKGLWTTSLNRMTKSDAWVDHVNFEKRTVRIDPTPALLMGIPGRSPKKAPAPSAVITPVSNPVVATTTSDHSTGEKVLASLGKKGKTPSHHTPTTSLASAAILKIPGLTPASTAQSTRPLTPVLPMKPAVIFTTHQGEMLSHDLREYLKKIGYHLAWKVSHDWKTTYGFTLTGSLADVMNHLMHLYPIDIVGEGANRTIVVSPVR
jgi:hypothetical protein